MDSSNTDTTSSDDYDFDDWNSIHEPRFNYAKTTSNFGKLILQNERNRLECAEWDLEAAIGSRSEFEGQEWVPLVIEEVENQMEPTGSVMSKIMAKYRRDLGFSFVTNFTEFEDLKEEARDFMKCFPSRPKPFDQERAARKDLRSEKRALKLQAEEKEKQQIKADWKAERKVGKLCVKFEKFVEAYSFLKEMGKIPNFSREISCEEVRARCGDNFRYLQDFREAYKTEFKLFTFLNWDCLDLTHFEFHYFPIVEQSTRNISTSVNLPVLTPRAMNILKAYEQHIKFHNPRTLEGRRALLFQKLYRRYRAVMKKSADPSFIDWRHCKVTNWPSHIDKSNFDAWSEDDVLLLEALVEGNEIKFERAEMATEEVANPLGMTLDFYSRSVTKIQNQDIYGATCALSDDEGICGPPAVKIGINNIAIKRKSVCKTEASRNLIPETKKIKIASNHPANPEERDQILPQALEITFFLKANKPGGQVFINRSQNDNP